MHVYIELNRQAIPRDKCAGFSCFLQILIDLPTSPWENGFRSRDCQTQNRADFTIPINPAVKQITTVYFLPGTGRFRLR